MKILLLILSMFVTQTVFSAEVEIRDLTINELQLQNKTRGWGLELLKQYDIKEATNIDALDRLFVSWYKDKSKEKVSDTQLIYGLSTLFGDFLTLNCECKWKVISDSYGVDFMVLSKGINESNIFVKDIVLKRAKSSEPELGFLRVQWDFLRGLSKSNP